MQDREPKTNIATLAKNYFQKKYICFIQQYELVLQLLFR